MPIYAKATGSGFTPAPAGQHAAVCVDVVDLGMVEVKWGEQKPKSQHKIRIIWQIDQDRDDGKPHEVSRRYTLSLHEKAALRKDLESWRGRAFTEAELEGFDVETVIGVPCLLSVIHAAREGGGQPYANISSIMKLHKSIPAPAPRDYVRVCDRPPSDGVVSAPRGWGEHGEHGDPVLTEDDIPF